MAGQREALAVPSGAQTEGDIFLGRVQAGDLIDENRQAASELAARMGQSPVFQSLMPESPIDLSVRPVADLAVASLRRHAHVARAETVERMLKDGAGELLKDYASYAVTIRSMVRRRHPIQTLVSHGTFEWVQPRGHRYPRQVTGNFAGVLLGHAAFELWDEDMRRKYVIAIPPTGDPQLAATFTTPRFWLSSGRT